MNTYCSHESPNEPELHCNRPAGNHESHSAYSTTQDKYVDWPNDAYVEPAKVTARKGAEARKSTLHAIGDRIRARQSQAASRDR